MRWGLCDSARKAEKRLKKLKKYAEVLFTKRGFRVKISSGLNRRRSLAILRTFYYASGDWQYIF